MSFAAVELGGKVENRARFGTMPGKTTNDPGRQH
jgi:hypothetical protein